MEKGVKEEKKQTTAAKEWFVEAAKPTSSDRKDGSTWAGRAFWTWEEKHSDSCVTGRWLSHADWRLEPEESGQRVQPGCVTLCSLFKKLQGWLIETWQGDGGIWVYGLSGSLSSSNYRMLMLKQSILIMFVFLLTATCANSISKGSHSRQRLRFTFKIKPRCVRMLFFICRCALCYKWNEDIQQMSHLPRWTPLCALGTF